MYLLTFYIVRYMIYYFFIITCCFIYCSCVSYCVVLWWVWRCYCLLFLVCAGLICWWWVLFGWWGCWVVWYEVWNWGPKTVKNGPRVWAFCKIEFPGIQKPVQFLTQKSGFFRNPGNRGVGVIWLVLRLVLVFLFCFAGFWFGFCWVVGGSDLGFGLGSSLLCLGLAV